MVDIHCHILPDVDDGSRSWEMSVGMCQMALRDGIDHIVATPHANDEFYYDRPMYEDLLRQLSERVGHRPQLSLGCDFHFSFENIQDCIENPRRFAIGHTRYLLVELSDFSIPPTTEENLKKFLDMGLRPILTHPERNPLLQRTPERVLNWADIGVLIQVTANSLTGRWGRKAQSMTEWLLSQGAVHVIATDAHSLESRPPVLSKAREMAVKMIGAELADALVDRNPRAIVEDRELS